MRGTVTRITPAPDAVVYRYCQNCGPLHEADLYYWLDGDVWCSNCGGYAEWAWVASTKRPGRGD